MQINCEEVYTVDPDEYDEVMRELAEESQAQQGFTESLEQSERVAYLEQQSFECQETQRKAWFNGYSNRQEGETYNGIAI